jgi:hypothetical protein
MASRSVGLSEMFGWIGDTFRLIGRDASAFMGASLVTLGVHLLFFAPLVGYIFWQMRGAGDATSAAAAVTPFVNGGATFWTLYAVSILGSLLLLPPLMVGWFRLCRVVDGGERTRALDLLAPYRDRAAWGRVLLTMLLVLVLAVAVFVLLALAFWSSLQAVVAQAAAQQAATLAGTTIAPPAPPVGFFVGYFVFLLVMVVIQAVYFVAVADVSLRPSSPVSAIRDAFAGVGRNSLKLLLFFVCVGIASFVVLLVVALVLGLLIAALSMLGTAAMVIGMLLLYIPLFLLMYPVMYAGSYFVWKSMLGDAAPPAVPDASLGVLPA